MSSASQLRATSRRDRHTSERGRLNGMARPCSYHRNVESDGNQHRSAVDPCQSTPDDSSVLMMLTPPTLSTSICEVPEHFSRCGGSFSATWCISRNGSMLTTSIYCSWISLISAATGQTSDPSGRDAGKSCRNHNDLLEACGGADARHYGRDAKTIC